MMTMAEAERVLRWTCAHRYQQVAPGYVVDRITGESRGGAVWDEDGDPHLSFIDLKPHERPEDVLGLTPETKVYSAEAAEHMQNV